MMVLIYRILYLPGLLLGLPYYAFRMWRRGGYRKGFSNRFGLMRNLPRKRKNVKRIWIQAVSVGELMAIKPLLEGLREHPQVEVILTTTTSTGYRVLEEKLSAMVAWYGIFPLDFWLFSRRAWRALQPDLAVLMEGELWPEHIHQAAAREVPVLLVNARLSDRSYRRHQKWSWLTRPYFRPLDAILAGSQTDRDRLASLDWIPDQQILMTGNLKMDVDLPDLPDVSERATQLKEFGWHDEDAVVLLGSSTWPGEEAALVRSYQSLKSNFPHLRLLIVPRHAERKKAVAEELGSFGIPLHFRSDGHQANPGTEIYIADTTGELGHLTRFADIVFVGKSLPPNEGGQTPVEAAALGKPLLFGPDMSNFRDISRQLVRNHAAIRLPGETGLEPAIRSLLEEPDRRREMGTAARSCIKASRGATGRVLDEILKRCG